MLLRKHTFHHTGRSPNTPDFDHKSEDTLLAKLKELNEWKKEQVYTDEKDKGQDCRSLRRVLKEKLVDGNKIIKARLLCSWLQRGTRLQKGHPNMLQRRTLLATAMITSNKWNLNSFDVKTTLVHSKVMERVVYVTPPQEANTNTIWRLRKCIYGLAATSRYWYLKLKEELVNLGANPLTLDQGVFLWFSNEAMIDTMVCFVDDVTWGGLDAFNSVIENLRSTFHIGSKNCQVFNYIGIHFEQKSYFTITVNPNSYTKTILPIPISKEQRDNHIEIP